MTRADGLSDLAAAVARSRPAGPSLRLAARILPARPGRFAILTYHRVAPRDQEHSLHPGLISASPEDFAAQMRGLASVRPVISLAQLLAARTGAPLPDGAVLLTFDDAYRDVAVHAWPVLRALGLPATLFVPTGFPGRGKAFWWDRLAAAILAPAGPSRLASPIGPLDLGAPERRHASLGRLQAWLKTRPPTEIEDHLATLEAAAGTPPAAAAVLDWDELRALAADGLTLAPHTVSHPLLTQVPAEEVGREVAASLADLEREIGPTPRALAYPSGAHDATVVAAVREAGIEIALTTVRGANARGRTDWLRLRRINVGGRSSPALIEAQLLAWTGGTRRRA